MIELTDQDILLSLSRFEDGFVERKTLNDLGDCLKTVVAFANTAPIGAPALMLVGVRNNGEVEGTGDLDKIQQRVSAKIADAYPPIYYTMKVLDKDGKRFLAVIVPGSDKRPHFAGQAYIRNGSKSESASEDQFQRLIAQRNSKSYELLKWRGKSISTWTPTRTGAAYNPSTGYAGEAIVVDSNQFYVTLRHGHLPGSTVTYPLDTFNLGFDHANNRLQIQFLAGVV